MKTLLLFVALVALSATAAEPQRFKLGAVVLERVFGCLNEADASGLVRQAATGDMQAAQAEAARLVERRVCGVGTVLLVYLERVLLIEAGGHLYAVYRARVGESTMIYVPLIDWTHEERT